MNTIEDNTAYLVERRMVSTLPEGVGVDWGRWADSLILMPIGFLVTTFFTLAGGV
jgi:hypothetical protein